MIAPITLPLIDDLDFNDYSQVCQFVEGAYNRCGEIIIHNTTGHIVGYFITVSGDTQTNTFYSFGDVIPTVREALKELRLSTNICNLWIDGDTQNEENYLDTPLNEVKISNFSIV
jgi:hypothetical protein